MVLKKKKPWKYSKAHVAGKIQPYKAQKASSEQDIEQVSEDGFSGQG